jgi:hypothetical protein
MYDNAELLETYFSQENLKSKIKVEEGLVELDDWVKDLPEDLIDIGILCAIKALNKMRYTPLRDIDDFLLAFYNKYDEMRITGELEEMYQVHHIRKGIFERDS